MMLRNFPKIAFITLVVLYLVILAGSVVRATGAGMGCPDWPKCFGKYIPPTDSAQVIFHPGKEYFKGDMVIAHDTLWVAENNFIGGQTIDASGWKKYPRHNYARFNVQQTWTEYINRLLGALSALFSLLLLVMSLTFFRTDKRTALLVSLGIFILAFVGWLGKVVVDTNLKPLTISMHMASALAMIAIVIYVYVYKRRHLGTITVHSVPSPARSLSWLSLGLTLLQIGLGIMVRQQVDLADKLYEGLHREKWLEHVDAIIYVHITAAWIVIAANAALFYLVRKTKPSAGLNLLLWLVLLLPWFTYGVGVLLKRIGMPGALQPAHLLPVTILFGVQFAILLRTRKA